MTAPNTSTHIAGVLTAPVILVSALAVAGLLGAPSASAQNSDPIAIDEEQPPAQFVAGEVIVQFRPGTSAETREQVLGLVGGAMVRPLDLSDTVLASVPVGTEIEAAESLGVDPNVVFAEPNGIVHTNATAE